MFGILRVVIDLQWFCVYVKGGFLAFCIVEKIDCFVGNSQKKSFCKRDDTKYLCNMGRSGMFTLLFSLKHTHINKHVFIYDCTEIDLICKQNFMSKIIW